MKFILKAKQKHIYTCICLHGMYQTNENFNDLGNYLQNNNSNLKLILVNAPIININWPSGIEYNVSSWYNYYSEYNGLMKYDIINNYQFQQQTNRIEKLIENEIKLYNINPKNIILLGESQGGTVAINAGLKSKYIIGGIIGIHTLFLCNEIKNYEKINNIPLHLLSGENDEIYNIDLQADALSFLIKKNFIINWNIVKNLKHSQYYEKLNQIVLSYINDILN